MKDKESSLFSLSIPYFCLSILYFGHYTFDNFYVTTINYSKYKVQDLELGVHHNKATYTVICDGWNFTHLWRTLA